MDLICKETTREGVRTQATTWIRFSKGEETVNLAFNSTTMAAYTLNDINNSVNSMISHMLEQIENPALRDSEFVMEEVTSTNIDFYRLNLMGGSSYLPLPDWISKKKAIINPRNDNMECFKWAVIAAGKWKEIGNNPERVSKLKRFEGENNWMDIEFPFARKHISKFKKNNEISVNILAVEDRQIHILRESTYDYKRIVNLMTISGENSFPEGKGKHNRKHYVAIKSLSRLLTSKNTKHESAHHCTNCLHGFTSEISKNDHESYCKSNKPVKIQIPTRKPYVRYSKGQYQFKVPFVMFADFKPLLTEPSKEEKESEIVNKHVPSGWCIKSKFAYRDVKDLIKMYRGKGCVNEFCNTRYLSTFPRVKQIH